MRSSLAVAVIYLVLYGFASYCDLATTSLVLTQTHHHEGNVFVTRGHAYQAGVSLMVTLGGALFMVACVVAAMQNAARVSERWLAEPIRSFAHMYVNPFTPRALAYSPIHLLSFALAFIPLRLLAAVNNALIFAFGIAPLGAPIEWIARRSSPVFGFVAVIVPVFYVLAVAMAPVAARVLRLLR